MYERCYGCLNFNLLQISQLIKHDILLLLLFLLLLLLLLAIRLDQMSAVVHQRQSVVPRTITN